MTSITISPSTITVIETSTPGAKTPLQSATGDPQAQASPPRNLGLPLGLGLGLALLLLIGARVLVYYFRRRARSQASANTQKGGEKVEPAEERAQEIGGLQKTEMDALDGRVGQSELSPGMSEETREMSELEGS